jgi:hypothetical protein
LPSIQLATIIGAAKMFPQIIAGRFVFDFNIGKMRFEKKAQLLLTGKPLNERYRDFSPTTASARIADDTSVGQRSRASMVVFPRRTEPHRKGPFAKIEQ